MIFLVCILVALAAILTIFHSSLALFLCCGVGAVCGAWILYVVIARPGYLRLTWLLASTLLIGFCFGAFNTEVSALLGGRDMIAALGIDPEWAAYALVLVMLSSITLVIAGWAETPVIREEDIVEMSWRQERFLWLGMALVAFALVHGDISQGGTVNNGGEESVVGAVAQAVGSMLPALAAIGVAQSTAMRRRRLQLLLVVSLVAIFPFGRRQLLYAVVITIFAAVRLSGRSWRISGGRKLLMTFGAVFVVVVASFFYIAMRMASWHLGEGNHSVATILEMAERTSLTNPDEIAANLGENVEDRTAFPIRYLALLGRGGDTPPPMYGQDAVLGAELATPDAFYRLAGSSKDSVREMGGEEELANEHFGLPVQDYANSILSGGIIDFGIVGILAYPVLLCVMGRLCLLLIERFVNEEGRLLAVLSIFYYFLQTESAVGSYLVDLRNTVILAGCWALLYALPRIGRRRRAVPAFPDAPAGALSQQTPRPRHHGFSPRGFGLIRQ